MMNFNKFFKKKTKPDSDGTCPVNEISYQQLPRANNSTPYPRETAREVPPTPPVSVLELSLDQNSGAFNNSFVSNENGSASNVLSKKRSENDNNNTGSRLKEPPKGSSGSVLGQSSSPRGSRKLLKPGCSEVSKTCLVKSDFYYIIITL